MQRRGIGRGQHALPSAPHIAFSKFESIIEELGKNSIPSVFDESVWPDLRKPARNEVIAALRFLSLVKDDPEPTDELAKVVRAYGTDEWPDALADVLRHSYQPLFADGLANMTWKQFEKRFGDAYPGSPMVLEKRVRFFLCAASAAKVQVSPRIARPSRTRESAARGYATRGVVRLTTQHRPQRGSAHGGPAPSFDERGSRSDIFYKLVDGFKGMTREERTAFMTMFEYLKRRDEADEEAAAREVIPKDNIEARRRR
jgi:hypothetical protein